MPILQPLGEILHINQQVLVLTYQYGDGITNSFWPGSSLVQLSMCGVDYGTWIRFCWKIYLGIHCQCVCAGHDRIRDRIRAVLEEINRYTQV